MTKTLLRFGIRHKLIFIICAMGLLPLTFIGYQAYNEQRRVLMEEVSRGHKELSNMLSHGIFESLENVRQLLASIVELDIIKQLNPVVAQDFFKSLLRHYPIFKLLYLVNGDRQIIASTDPATTLPPDWRFSHAVKRSYQGSLSEVSQTPEGNPYMTLETVIKSPEKGVIGVLASEVDLLYIRTLLINALKRSKSQGLVLDETGTVIARSAPEVQTISVSAAEVLDQDINGVRDVNGTSFLVTAVSLKKFNFYQAPNWTIILQIPEAVAFQAADELKQRVLTLGVLTGIVALILAILLANHFVGPLMNLITNARFMSRGAFDHEIVSTSKDEIGELARTFNEMRVNLKNTKADLDYRIIQLSTLYEVGKAISSELDFVKLQNMILEIVARVLRAEKASLMLLDETEKILTIGTAFGLSEEVAKGTRIGVGEAVAGWVLESGKPLFVQDVESDHAFLALKKSNISSGTLMSVPLRAKDKILGVLNVSRSEPNSFSAKDFELFQNLANQAAIAIENARLYRYAVTDEMTKVYNHRYFQQRLDEELQRADRYDSRVSLIMLDVDHFKRFNDTYGHPEGDRVLKTVSKLIEKSVREVDIVARYGGEEFMVICPEKDGEGAMIPANRIRTAIEGFDFRINGQPVPITVSLGVCSYPDQARSKPELVMSTDIALYYSKEAGRNRASHYSPSMHSEEMLKAKAEKKKKKAEEEKKKEEEEKH